MTTGRDAAIVDEAAANLHEAAAAKKCWPCGCLHQGLAAIHALSQVGGGDAAAVATCPTHQRWRPRREDRGANGARSPSRPATPGLHLRTI